MTETELELFHEKFRTLTEIHERIELLDQQPEVQKLLQTSPFFRLFLQGLSPECESALKQAAALGQIDGAVLQADRWRDFLHHLLKVDRFYRELGGIIGYQAVVMKLLRKKESVQIEGTKFHSPVFEDISKESDSVLDAIRFGLESQDRLAEIYPLGGAADRLHLVDEETGLELPAAKLQFAGKTLLETLIRDLQAREWLYFRLFGRQVDTPIAIMTSGEKDNHRHILNICEEHGWFGRPKHLFRLFQQPLVPTVDEKGNWHTTAPLKLLLKPGGHGAIWKLARDEGVFTWLKNLGVKKALVRQINNPLAGLDYGLIAFAGLGCSRDMHFGFASCSRLIKSAEGMLVLVEKEGKIALTNVEYCDFAKFGIEDKPLHPGGPYSRFTSNTNILFIDLNAIERAVASHPFPGLLMNLKPSGEKLLGRLESTMQNIADAFAEPKKEKTEKTFVTYNVRHKTISVAKKAYLPGSSYLETPEHCFYELGMANLELLQECGFTVPVKIGVEEYLSKGPSALFLYHPALGPLYSIIRQKLRRGNFSPSSEMILEIAEVDLSHLSVEGSLRIVADQILGPQKERLLYSTQVGRCQLHNCTIRNRGVDWEKSSPFWRMNLQRDESLFIELKGNSEFIAENVQFKGNLHFVVEDGVCMRVYPDGWIEKSAASKKGLWRYEWNKSGLDRPLLVKDN